MLLRLPRRTPLALLLCVVILALVVAPSLAHKHDSSSSDDKKHESKDHSESRHTLRKELDRAEDKIDKLKHEHHKDDKQLEHADSKIKDLKDDRDKLEHKLSKERHHVKHDEHKLDKEADELHHKKKEIKEREHDVKHDEHKLSDLKDDLHDREKHLEHRADKLHERKKELKAEAKEVKHRAKEVKIDEKDVAKREKKLDKEEQARENYYYKSTTAQREKYAAPYEHYWRNENRTDEFSHHVDHGKSHHAHHGTKHHASRERGHGEQPEMPAPEYEKYYKQYLPVGVAQTDRHHPASPSSASAVESDSLPAAAPAESLSESASYSKYMDSADSYSAGPEIDASSQMSSKFYEPYESMFDKFMPDGVPVKASASERPAQEHRTRYGRHTENLPPYPRHPHPHEAPEWTDPKLTPEERHAEYARSREVERQHERMKHQRKHHGRSHLHRSSDPDASEHSYRKHGGHEFEYSGHHDRSESGAPAAASSSPQSSYGGGYEQYYKQYIGGNNLVERSEDTGGDLDMDQQDSSNESYATRHDESDTKTHVTHKEDVRTQLPPQQQPQQQQSQPQQQQPPLQPPSQPSQTQPAHPSNPVVQSPFVPASSQTNITSSERNTTVSQQSDPADRHGDEPDVIAAQVLVEKHAHHKHDKHKKEHEHESKHESKHEHKHKHEHKGGEQPEQPEQREQREQPEQPQQDWHSGDRGYGGEQPEQTEQDQQRWWRPPSESTSLVESAPAPAAAAVASPASLEAMLPMDNSDSFGTVSVISLGVMFVMLAGVMVFGGGRSRWGFKHVFGGAYPPATEPLLPTTEPSLDPRQAEVVTTGSTGRAYQSV